MALETFGCVTESLNGTAPSRFIASTTDSLATILAAGYMNYWASEIKANDIVEINYLDASVFPLNTGESALYASFMVQYDPVLANWNLLLRSSVASGIAAYGVESSVSTGTSASATFTITDPAISVNSVVLARLQASGTSARIETVLPANGSFVVTASVAPGAYTLEYISILPSMPLQNAGVIAAKATVVGASATVVISNASITASSIVNVNCVSQTNASYVLTANATAGTLTIVFNTAPGASVISYTSVTPSTALTALGYYGAQYANAGGSTTITITDANITASSIVIADLASEANVASVYKVTPSASTLTLLVSADPGVSTVNYSATAVSEQPGSNAGPFLPLAGGQMLGTAYLAKGVATSTAAAATINKQSGVVTTESLTTAAASAYAFTLTNSQISSSSVVSAFLMGGSNTTRGLEIRCIPVAGSVAISIFNNNVAGTALNGTLIFGFEVL